MPLDIKKLPFPSSLASLAVPDSRHVALQTPSTETEEWTRSYWCGIEMSYMEDLTQPHPPVCMAFSAA